MTKASRARRAVSPKQRRGIEAKDRILNAALAEFAAHGYEHATTRSIGERAGENRALIIYYFGNKEELWKACMDRHFSNVLDRLASAIQSVTGAEPEIVARTALREMVELFAKYPEQLRILTAESGKNSDRIKWLAESYLRNGYELFASSVEALKQRGMHFEHPNEHIYYALVGASSLIFAAEGEFEIVTGSKDFGTPEFIRRQTDLITDIFFNRLVNWGSSTAADQQRPQQKLPTRRKR